MIVNANSFHIPLAPRSVHMVACSPPYWGLRSYATGGNKRHEIGAEPLHDCLAWAREAEPCGGCYVCALRSVAREVRRVLRDDGVWWLNLGESYASGAGGRGDSGRNFHTDGRGGATGTKHDGTRIPRPQVDGLKPKDLAGVPWRVALALQADGWYLRSDIVWAKPNPMPESVTDRPTKAHEYVFLLAKSARYYYDAEAVKETADPRYASRYGYDFYVGEKELSGGGRADGASNTPGTKVFTGQRNRRTVWTVATQPYAGAHYAVWPPALVEPMILAGTSARGVCSACGAQWVRVVERVTVKDQLISTRVNPSYEHLNQNNSRTSGLSRNGNEPSCAIVSTTGWQPACSCDAPTVPAIVLDPFAGSGTTGMVARLHGRRFVGLDLSMEYLRGQALARAEGLTPPEAIAELPLFAEKLP